MTRFRIRPATPADAEEVAALAAALSAEEGVEPPAFDAQVFRRFGFGPEPAFLCLVADAEPAPGRLLGFVLVTRGFDGQAGTPGYVIEDLYVVPEARRQGLGRALVQAVGVRALDAGYSWISWHVMDGNDPARAFYRAIGAVDEPVRTMSLVGAALEWFVRDPARTDNGRPL